MFDLQSLKEDDSWHVPRGHGIRGSCSGPDTD